MDANRAAALKEYLESKDWVDHVEVINIRAGRAYAINVSAKVDATFAMYELRTRLFSGLDVEFHTDSYDRLSVKVQ